jgi:hypothetical protein
MIDRHHKGLTKREKVYEPNTEESFVDEVHDFQVPLDQVLAHLTDQFLAVRQSRYYIAQVAEADVNPSTFGALKDQ